MHVAITGASGLIGRALTSSLTGEGHTVTRLVRRTPAAADEAGWDPSAGTIDTEALARADAVVHLAGESIASSRWTDDQKRRIRDSRVQGTRLVAESVASLASGPAALVCASAIGYYGERGDEALTEDSGPGEDFLAGVVADWEAAGDPAREAGVRVAHLRTGIVQSTQDGALAKQLPLFKLGVGGRLGSGRQYMSWVAMPDVVGCYVHTLTADVAGPLNVTAPNPVTNAEYARTLGSVLGRPAVLPVPRFGPRLVLGEMADALLFTSQRVLPERTTDHGYEFRSPRLEPALREILGR